VRWRTCAESQDLAKGTVAQTLAVYGDEDINRWTSCCAPLLVGEAPSR